MAHYETLLVEVEKSEGYYIFFTAVLTIYNLAISMLGE